MLQYRLYGGAQLPANLEGFMKAGANIGSVIGQFAFGTSHISLYCVPDVQGQIVGYAADSLGRKAVCEYSHSFLKSTVCS